MSLLSRALYQTAVEPEVRSVSKLESIPTPFEDARSSQDPVNAKSAMTLGAFYACVTLLADTIGSLSCKAYKEQNEARVPLTPQPALLLGSSPYPGLTWFDWLWMLIESLAVTGNGFCLVTQRGRDGRPTALMPVHPDDVSISLPEGDQDWPDPIYSIKGTQVRKGDMMHIKRYPVASKGWGMSPVEKAAADIGLALQATKFGLRWFKDSATPSGILSSEQDLTPEQTKRAMKSWIQSHQGRRLPAVLSGGFTWQTVSLTPNESQFLETRGHQASEVAMWFRVPPHMIGITEKSTSWGTGIEQQSIGFVTYTLKPWLTCIEQALSMYLPNGTFLKFNIDGLLRGDVKARWEAYRLGREAGVYSVNDIRAMEDLPPVEDGDGRIQPMNFAPLGYEPPDEPPPAARTSPATGEEGSK